MEVDINKLILASKFVEDKYPDLVRVYKGGLPTGEALHLVVRILEITGNFDREKALEAK